jgi:VCBS repeat-containing protein
MAMAVTVDPSGTTSTSMPTIQSDQADYPPGGTVTLTGSNWQAGESVHIYVNDDVGRTWSRDVDVTADESGQIKDQFQLPDWFVANYSVKATGTSGAVATTTFTDASFKVSGTFAGSTTDTYTLTYQRYSGTASGTTCGGTLRSGDTPAPTEPNISSTSTFNVPQASQSCAELTAPATSNGGRPFVNWTDSAGDVVSDTVVTGGGHRIAVDYPPNGTEKTYKANYGPLNRAPVANGQSVTTDEDTNKAITLAGSDADGNNLTYSIVSGPAKGTLSGSGANQTYTPNSNFNGSDSFTFKVNDGTVDSNTATVSISVTAVDDNPVAVNDNKTVAEDANATTIDVRANDTDVDGGPKSIQSVTQPTNGTVEITNSGADLTYKPKADYCNGGSPTDDFNYTLNGGSTAKVAVTVTCVNDAPKADAQSVTTAEDTAKPITLSGTDADGDSLTYSIDTGPANGTLSGSGANPTYTPNSNFNGSDSFTFKVDDGKGGTATATVSITVTPVNDKPKADAQSVTTAEDTAKPITLSGSDPEGDNLTYSVVDAPANGTLSGSGANPTYTPNSNFNGSDSFTFKVNDGNLDSDKATVSITVNAVNDAPKANDDAKATDEDQTLTFPSSDLKTNDSDVDGDTLSVSSVGAASHGTTNLANDGTVTYTPATNYNGPDSFTYTVSDGNGGTATAKVDVTVNPVNDAPKANDDAKSTDEDQTLTFPSSDLVGNDSDVDGDTLSVSSVGSASHGTASLVSGTVKYVPNANYNGPDSFTYTVSDGNGGTATAKVDLTVRPVNDDPVAADDAKSTDEDQTLTFPSSDLKSNDSDVDGDSLSVTSVGAASHGTTNLANDGTVTYTPAANYNGPDSFTYTVSDGNGGTATAKVDVTVNPVNDNPVAADDAKSTNEDTTLTFPSSDLKSNDSDVDGDALSVTNVGAASHGTTNLANDGTVTYTPATNYNGPDSFTYTVSDGNGGTATAKVDVTVKAVNDAPVANDNNYTTDEDTALNVAAPGLLGNDTDVEGDPLHVADGNTNSADGISPVSGPAHGTVNLNANGSFTYTPATNYNGSDSFDYRVCDNGSPEPKCSVETANVSITVNAINDAPVANDDTAETAEDTALNNINVLGNDTDVEGDQLVVSSVGAAAHGTASLDNGVVSYTPAANYNGSDSFSYTVSDGNGGTEQGTVNVNVTPVNDDPVATADTKSTPEDTTLTVPAPGVLGNDSDVDGDTLSAALATQATNGIATLNADGSFSYNPAPNYNGSDSFTYTVSDGHGGTATGQVTINVNSVNDAPTVKTAAADDKGKNEGANLSTQGAFEDTKDNDPLSITKTAGAGTVVDNHDGTWSWSLQTNDNVSGTVTVTASDGNGGTVTDSFDYSTINVAPTVTSITPSAQNALAGPTNSVTFTGAATDPSSIDAGGLFWHWAVDSGTYNAYGAANANTYKASFSTCGLHTVSAQAKDKDNGVSAPFTVNYANVYSGAYKAPLVDGTVNMVQKGQVIPVKISVGCGATNLTGLSPYIQLLSGDVSPETEAGSTALTTTTSVSSADTGQTMRPVDGGYIYNLQVPSNATANTKYTIRVNPFGAGADNAATGMYVVIQIRK